MATEFDFRPSRAALAQAIQLIANDRDYTDLRRQVAKLAGLTHGGFVGHYAALNVLVELARERGEKALEPLWDLADRKHVQAYPSRRKTTYQASYMAQRRRRQARAVALYERYHDKSLTAVEKDNLKGDLQALWMVRRNEVLWGTQPGDERNEVVRLYWEEIDDLIERGLAGDTGAARRVLGEEE